MRPRRHDVKKAKVWLGLPRPGWVWLAWLGLGPAGLVGPGPGWVWLGLGGSGWLGWWAGLGWVWLAWLGLAGLAWLGR